MSGECDKCGEHALECDCMYCNYCDPKFYVVYGFCGNCGRRCEPPLIGEDMDIHEYMEFRRKWNQERSDLILDTMRQLQHDT